MVGNASGSVTVRLGALREPLAIYCAASGASASEAIRELLGKSLLDLSASDNSIHIDVESVPRVRLELRLTPREREVCGWLVEGLLNKDIAVKLGTTDATIKVHKARVMSKMHVDSVQTLVKKYLESDLSNHPLNS